MYIKEKSTQGVKGPTGPSMAFLTFQEENVKDINNFFSVWNFGSQTEFFPTLHLFMDAAPINFESTVLQSCQVNCDIENVMAQHE